MCPPEMPARTSVASTPSATEAPAPSLADTVAALLSQSRAAHDRKKKAAGLTDKKGIVTRHPDYPTAEAETREALRLREEAHALDPDHTAPAWSVDQAANKGLSHRQMCDWLAFYQTIP
jgi:hypothetical protein